MNKELKTLNERIAEKVGESLVDLIPPEKWQALVDSEIRVFMRDKAPSVIQEELTKMLRKKVSTVLNQVEMQSKWDSLAGEQLNETIKQMLEQSAPVVFSAMLQPVMTGFLGDLRSRLLQQY